ncbi:MAG TPA: sigma-70 family RNA polymerase sigma factor [Ilumatobacter sp.]|nr:sigma-70 family RNA polymerase sigma factor [Ilumatobacter sp.]
MGSSSASFEPVFREQYPRLAALGAAMTGSLEAGHDLAQETMLRAYDRWDTVGGNEYLGAWLRRVLTNLAIDRHRSSVSESAALTRATVERFGETPALAEWSELIDGLDQRQRVVVTLFYGEDRSIDDIADLLGVPEGSVKSSLWRARQRLRDIHGGEARDA